MDRYSEVLLGASSGQFYYIVLYGSDMTGAAKEFMQIQLNEQPDPKLEQEWVAKVAPGYLDGVPLSIGGQPLELRLAAGAARPSLGHGGVPVIEVALIAEFDYPPGLTRGEPLTLSIDDLNFIGPRSWLQTRVVPLEGVVLEGHQPYGNLAPFNYYVLDNANILPATRKMDLEIVLPVADQTAPTSGETVVMGYVDPSGHQQPGEDIPPDTAYGPSEFTRLSTQTDKKDPWGGQAKVIAIFLAGAGAFVLGAAALVVYRLTHKNDVG